MRRAFAAVAILALASCSPKPNEPRVSREPISVRGWIADVDTGTAPGMFRTVETEAARRRQTFQATNVWVDNAPYVSGGVAETGAFVLLDVPPGDVTISFSAPGVPDARLLLQHVPGNADVVIPGLILKPSGTTVVDAKQLQVRIAAAISRPQATPQKAIVAGATVPVTLFPINSMIDRRDYLTPPGFQPVATVK